MRTNIFRRAVVAGATVAVATAGLAAVTSTSANAASDPADFVCTVSILGEKPFTVTADTNLPATVEQGKPVTFGFTARVSVPDDVRSTARFVFGEEVKGSADISATAGGVAAPVVADLPVTTIPAETGPLVLDVAGTGKWTPTTVGSQEIRVSGFTTSLTFIKGGVESPTPLSVPCVAPASGPVLVDTVEVTKAVTPAVVATKTTAKAKYAKKTKKATVNVKVVNNKKKAVKGKVKLTLKKGKKVVGKKTVTLNKKGVAKGVFKVKAKGKYTVVAQYQGTKTTKKSKATAKFTVKK